MSDNNDDFKSLLEYFREVESSADKIDEQALPKPVPNIEPVPAANDPRIPRPQPAQPTQPTQPRFPTGPAANEPVLKPPAPEIPKPSTGSSIGQGIKQAAQRIAPWAGRVGAGVIAATTPGNIGQNYPFPQEGPLKNTEINISNVLKQ